MWNQEVRHSNKMAQLRYVQVTKNLNYLRMSKILSVITIEPLTLNYGMISERYPKPNGLVGDSMLSCEIFSIFDGKLARWPHAFCISKNNNNNINNNATFINTIPSLETNLFLTLHSKTLHQSCKILYQSGPISLNRRLY